MKKFLIATTALVATAGVAAADVAVSADGRFGISHNAGANTINGRVRVNFALSAMGDNGLEFGGRLRIHQNFDAYPDTSEVLSHLFIGAEGFRLSIGAIDGALVNRVAVYGGGLGYSGRIGRPLIAPGLTDFSGTPVIRADYSDSGLGVSLSSDFDGNNLEVSAGYSMDGLSAAIGYDEASSSIAISASYRFDDFTVGALYTTAADDYRLWASYTMGDITVGATYTNNGADNFGVGASYGLGGGARLHGAVGQHAGATQAELGVTFSF